MKKSIRKDITASRLIIMLTIASCLFSCSARQKERFSDSLFVYQGQNGEEAFSYVLSLENPPEGTDIQLSQVLKNPDSRIRREHVIRDPLEPENPDDALVPLKFRMEELAFGKLDQALKDKHYCPNGYQIKESEFENAKYRIKGTCKLAEQ